MQWSPAVISGVTLGVGLLIVSGVWLCHRCRQYIDLYSTCGFLPPPPSGPAGRLLVLIARFIVFIQVGAVKVIGKEHLKTPGPILWAPNHSHFADGAVLALCLPRPARYMARREVMQSGCGLLSLLLGPFGVFATDATPGKGGPARQRAVEVLISGQDLVIFPEGYAYLDGVMGTFKKGAVRIARAAGMELQSCNRPIHIVPVLIRYGRYPDSWIRNLSPNQGFLHLFLSLWYYRRDVTVVFGTPIASAELPVDDYEATRVLEQQVASLSSLL